MNMTVENNLLTKTYYSNLMNEDVRSTPIQTLADLYLKEVKGNSSTLANIRYAQGELYFHYKDYETAIFKWQSVENDLKPWARKNMADAYFELRELDVAEEIYKSIESDNLSLNTEVALKLFAIYRDLGQLERATQVIKNVIAINTDYPSVTHTARCFFEEYSDWGNAIDLAVHEANRTQSLRWFDTIQAYAAKGVIKKQDPAYFTKLLKTLYSIDIVSFEKLTVSLWENYKYQQQYFAWLTMVNQLFNDIDTNPSEGWKELAILFQEAYRGLIKGEYPVNELTKIVPVHLENWLKVTQGSNAVVAASAIVAWNEQFPESINTATVKDAEQQLNSATPPMDGLTNSLQLLMRIVNWAKHNGIDIQDKLAFVVQDLASLNRHELTSDVASAESISLLLKELSEKAPNETEKVESAKELNKNINGTILRIIRQTIAELFEQRVDRQNSLAETIQLNKDIVLKLDGAMNQLKDLENEKIQGIRKSFSLVKEDIKREFMSTLPDLLRGCSKYMNENSDFGTIHLQLNTEMNATIKAYLQETIIPKFITYNREWLELVKEELLDSQAALDELSEGLNALYETNELTLKCDFQILNDWTRDTGRIAAGADVDDVNILSGYNPALLLLKGSGKLFEYVPANKMIVYKAYKKFIENESYHEVVTLITKQFMLQFELFEKTVDRDIKEFFAQPFSELDAAIEAINGIIEKDKDSLDKLKSNPEVYFDPIRLFEVNLRQYEQLFRLETSNSIA